MTTETNAAELMKTGEGLVEAIKLACEAAGKSIAHLAPKLGISTSHWAGICSGAKSIRPLMKDKQARDVVAGFLAVPPVQVMALAELVEPEDFVIHQSLDDQLNAAYLLMQADTLWSSLVPRPVVWDDADRAMKLLVVTMYQSATRASMLEKVGLVLEGQAKFARIDARKGLAPALDQLGKWGQAPRQAA